MKTRTPLTHLDDLCKSAAETFAEYELGKSLTDPNEEAERAARLGLLQQIKAQLDELSCETSSGNDRHRNN